MKYLFILSLFILTLSSCSDVNDITNEKIQLINGYELIYRDTVNSVIKEYPFDTIGTNRIIFGRFIYTPGLKINDKVKFEVVDTMGLLLMMNEGIVQSTDTTDNVIYSLPFRTNSAGLKFSKVKLFRKDSLIWTGRDTIFVK